MHRPTYALAVVFCLLSTLLFFPAMGQTTLTGMLHNASGEPLGFGNVLLLSLGDSALVKGAVAEEDGRFVLSDVGPGSYALKVSMVGYREGESGPLQVDGSLPKMDLGNIVLEETVSQLSEVEVKARKPLFEQEVDRLVVNVQNSVTAAGNTALDILERSPGVIVNRQANTLSIGGKSGVMVLINGKRNRMPMEALVQLLASTNAGNIERIEILTAPPARYDADGNAGAINIIMKESPDEGFNGSVSGNAGYGWEPKVGGNFLFNWRTGGLNLFGDYSFLHDPTRQEWASTNRLDYEGVLTESFTFSDRDPFTNTHNGRIGFDLVLGKKTVMGLSFTGNSRYWHMDAVNQITVDTNQALQSRMVLDNREVNHWTQMAVNLNALHTFQPEHSLEFNLDYLNYHNDNPSFYELREFDANGQPTDTEAFRLGKLTPIRFWVPGLDYGVPLGENIRLQAGVKGTFSQFENDILLETFDGTDWVTDPDFSAVYELDENIGAAYTQLSFSVGKQVAVDLGLRYEHTLTNLGTEEEPNLIDRNYGNWFPSVFFTYAFRDRQSFQASYNRRINRPGFTQLAPFAIFISPFVFITGNPALQPSITDAGRIGYQWKNYLISLQYSYEDEAIATWQPITDPETNERILMAQNMNYTQTLDLTLSVPVYVGNWWEMQNNLSGVWQESEARFTREPLTVSNRYLRINSTHTFSLPAQFTLEIGGWWQTPSLNGIWERNAFGALNLGIQKSFGENGAGGTLNLNVSDLFNTINWDWDIDYPDLYLQANEFIDFETRVVRLTYSIQFGNRKLKGRRNRRDNAQDAQQRVSY